MSPKDQDNQTPGAIDLGLGSLLQSEPEITQETEKKEDPPAVTQPVPQLSEFDSLYSEQRYSEMVSLAESRLENSSQNKNEKWIESQAWWLVAQVKMRAFPATVLEAPFDSFLETMAQPEFLNSEQMQKLCKLAVTVYLEELVCEGALRPLLQSLSKLPPNLSFDLRSMLEKISVNSASMNPSERQMLSDLRLKSRMPGLSLIEEPAVTEVKTEIVQDNFGASAPNRGLGSFFWVIIAVIMGSAAFMLIPDSMEQKRELISLLKSRVQSPRMKMQLPEPTLATEFSELDAMLYEVNRKIDHANPPETMPVKETPPAKETALVEKVKVDTTGPKETEELRKLRTQKPVQEKGSIVPGPAQAPHFKEFPGLRMYEVVRPTSLMSQPSPRSEAVAGLSPGDFVQVQAREGYWLRVISKQGKTAYVLAEDLQPAN